MVELITPPAVVQEVMTAADNDVPVLEFSVDEDLEAFGVGKEIRKPASPQQH